MSVPFCAALAWISGTATFAGLHAFTATDVLAIIPMVEVVADGERARYHPKVIAHLADGSVLEWEDEGAEAYSLSWDSAVGMAHSLCAEAGIDDVRARALIDAIRCLDTMPNIGVVTAAMESACREARRMIRRPVKLPRGR